MTNININTLENVKLFNHKLTGIYCDCVKDTELNELGRGFNCYDLTISKFENGREVVLNRFEVPSTLLDIDVISIELGNESLENHISNLFELFSSTEKVDYDELRLIIKWLQLKPSLDKADRYYSGDDNMTIVVS